MVSEEAYFAVQSILQQNTKQWSQRKSRKNEFLCTDILYCECGLKMFSKKDNRAGKPSYYICSSNYNGKVKCGRPMADASKADKEVWGHLVFRALSKGFVEREIKKSLDEKKQDSIRGEVDMIEREIVRLKQQRERIVDCILDAKDDLLAVWRDRQKKNQNQLADAEVKLMKARSQILDLSKADIGKLAEEFRRKFLRKGLSALSKKALLKEFVRKSQSSRI